jgi:trimeric autotransporter adhesin
MKLVRKLAPWLAFPAVLLAAGLTQVNTLWVTSAISSLSKPGAFVMYGHASLNETDFVNQNNGSNGGFYFYNGGAGAIGSTLAILGPSGFTTSGITANSLGVSGSATVNGNITAGTVTSTGALSAGSIGTGALTASSVLSTGNISGNTFGPIAAAPSPASQGAYVGWNQAGAGETDIISSKGSGAGGINFYSGGTGALGSPIVTMSSTGVMNVPNYQKAHSSGCTTAAPAGSTCTSTVTWPTTFADTNYSAACSINGPTGFPSIQGYSKSAGSITVSIQNGTSNEGGIAAGGPLDCVAID